MGTVWVFKPTESFSFSQLCTSRMVERFGKDDNNWEHIELDFSFQVKCVICFLINVNVKARS
jgi:hypothetical protein